MSLSREVYKEFEDLVGAENICDNPTIMPSYFSTNFAAVILPQDTLEVQAIVRMCNKHKIKFRPVCTGWTGSFTEGTLLLDLRRMNHILEINEQNMYAVVEPYVISAELQSELMKRGLNFSMKGAGAHCTAMLRGHGHTDESTGADNRNHLALEWVTPEGDIVRLGALGSTDDWFSGDGPGPSLRSLISSVEPPGITPGVFTKMAVKLYHWPGPVKFPIQGKSPKYTLSSIPPNMMARYFSFPSIEKMWQAELKVGENEIAFELMGFIPAMVACNITTCSEEEIKVFQQMSREVQGPGFFIIIAGNSKADFNFKKKVLEKIIEDADGQSLKMVENPEIEGILLCQCIRISASIRETARAAGAHYSISLMGQRDLGIKWAIGAGEAKARLLQEGKIIDDGGSFFGWGVEHGHLGKTEIFCKFDPTNLESKKAVQTWLLEQGERAYTEHYFANLWLEGQADKVGPGLSNYHLWWNKFKTVIDPNNVIPEEGTKLR
jgi:glycolate oxidase